MAWEGSTRSERLPPNWRTEIRPAVFKTYGTICHVCGKDGANEADHVTPGDDHSLENLRPIHKWPCHARKSAREGGQAHAARQRLRYRPKPKHPGLR